MSRRVAAALLTAMLVTGIGAGPVAADDTARPHSGNFGAHALLDTRNYAGVTCVYPGPNPNVLASIRIRAPIVYAFDRTGGIDTEWVGWRYRIQGVNSATPAESDWQSVALSTVVTARATDGRNATWTNRTYHLTNALAYAKYRVLVTMLWYFPDRSRVDGNGIHRPDYFGYAIGNDPPVLYMVQYCGATLG